MKKCTFVCQLLLLDTGMIPNAILPTLVYTGSPLLAQQQIATPSQQTPLLQTGYARHANSCHAPGAQKQLKYIKLYSHCKQHQGMSLLDKDSAHAIITAQYTSCLVRRINPAAQQTSTIGWAHLLLLIFPITYTHAQHEKGSIPDSTMRPTGSPHALHSHLFYTPQTVKGTDNAAPTTQLQSQGNRVFS